jgi:hypothetical protein
MTSARYNIRKIRSDGDTVSIDLCMPASSGVTRPTVAGDFTAWVPVPMEAGADGAFRMRFVIPRGSELRYRISVDDDDHDARSCIPRPLARVTV